MSQDSIKRFFNWLTKFIHLVVRIQLVGQIITTIRPKKAIQLGLPMLMLCEDSGIMFFIGVRIPRLPLLNCHSRFPLPRLLLWEVVGLARWVTSEEFPEIARITKNVLTGPTWSVRLHQALPSIQPQATSITSAMLQAVNFVFFS